MEEGTAKVWPAPIYYPAAWPTISLWDRFRLLLRPMKHSDLDEVQASATIMPYEIVRRTRTFYKTDRAGRIYIYDIKEI